jgi:DNA-binding PadR family transcriptional regulator
VRLVASTRSLEHRSLNRLHIGAQTLLAATMRQRGSSTGRELHDGIVATGEPAHPAQTYTLLGRLTDSGFASITLETHITDDGIARNVQVYELTAAGKSALDAALLETKRRIEWMRDAAENRQSE